MATVAGSDLRVKGFHLNRPPAAFSPRRDLPAGFLEFLEPLHRRFTPWQHTLVQERARRLGQSLEGDKPSHRFPAEAVRNGWHIELPEWCQDQRCQITGPADDSESVAKMLASEANGVILDLEDTVVNDWRQQRQALQNVLQALRGTIPCPGKSEADTNRSKPVIWTRPRGLHISQAGIFTNELTSASLFDVARIAFQVDPAELQHPLSFYIPKSESADEALWWRDLFQAISAARGWPRNYIKCMALVESHPLAFQMEEFLYNLREHALGLAFGECDYIASVMQFNYEDPKWVLPDRNTIQNAPFIEKTRDLLTEICHKRSVLAIDSIPDTSREYIELNTNAGPAVDKPLRNGSECPMDGIRIRHPEHKGTLHQHFSTPNQLHKRRPHAERYPDLRPAPCNLGERTLNGTRAAIRAAIQYRNAVLNGKGVSMVDGYVDLATDRVHRLLIAQRMQHATDAPVLDRSGSSVEHTPELIAEIFDEQLEMLLANPTQGDIGSPETLADARQIAEAMIINQEFDPI
jgi:malate synthase